MSCTAGAWKGRRRRRFWLTRRIQTLSVSDWRDRARGYSRSSRSRIQIRRKVLAQATKNSLVKPEITIVNIVGAVDGGVPAEAIGQGRVVEVAPVGYDVVLVVSCPDVGLDGKDDLMVLGISQAGQDRGKVSLAVLAGIERKIRAQHSREPGLESIAGGGKGGNMELVFVLAQGIDPTGTEVFQEGAAKVNQIKLLIRLCKVSCADDRTPGKVNRSTNRYSNTRRITGYGVYHWTANNGKRLKMTEIINMNGFRPFLTCLGVDFVNSGGWWRMRKNRRRHRRE